MTSEQYLQLALIASAWVGIVLATRHFVRGLLGKTGKINRKGPS